MNGTIKAEIIFQGNGRIVIRPLEGELSCTTFARVSQLPNGALVLEQIPPEVSYQTAAEFLQCSVSQICRLVESGELIARPKSIRPGRRVRNELIKFESLQAYKEELEAVEV